MAWFGRFLLRRQMYNDLSEEMHQHLDEKTEKLVSQGLSREEAERAAHREFGNVTLLEERSREVWGWGRVESLRLDTQLAVRQLKKSPAFTVTAILTLALGIGANTGVFTLMHALLFRSLPVAEPERLVRIALDVNSPYGAADDMPLNLFLLQSIERHARSLSGVFGWSSYDFVLKEDTGMHVFSGAVVSGNTFQVLGVVPAAGRLLVPADDRKGGGPDGWAAVISYRFWQEHYHGDRSVIGKHIMLTDHSVTVVGVAPKGFEGVLVAMHPDFYLPLEYEPVMRGSGSVLRMPGNLWLTTWARLAPHTPVKLAAAEMHSLFKVAADETIPPAVRHMPVIERSTFALRPGGNGGSSLVPQYAQPLILLQSLVGVVLLVCCVNLAGLCMARASTREHEFAIRGALGAARGRLMQQPLLESLVLALSGGALAVAIAWGVDRYLLRFLADRQAVASLSIRPEPVTLLVTGGCAVVCALLFGVAPAWLASRTSFEPALRRKANALSRKGEGLARWFFVAVQIALSLVLVVIAAMLSATVFHLRTTALGFHTKNVILVPADFERIPQKGSALVQLYRRMIAGMEGMPGILSVSVAESTPLSGRWQTGFFASTAVSASTASPASHYSINDVGANYFAALGTRVLAGRHFAESDTDASTCMLNQSAADALFPNSSALGLPVWQSIGSMNTGKTTSRECRVVGVVEDAKYASLREGAPPTVYYPFGTQTDRLFSMFFVIHARSTAEASAAYHSVLHTLAPESPEAEPVAFASQFEDSIGRERLLSVLSGFFAALALLLSSIGIYGLLASHVTRRTTEIGVRIALGATRGRILAHVLSRAAMVLSIGVVVGVGLAWLAARSIRSFLFDVSAGDWNIFLAAIVLLAVSGLAAAFIPASRAVFVDPMEALRTE